MLSQEYIQIAPGRSRHFLLCGVSYGPLQDALVPIGHLLYLRPEYTFT